jgi:hypothetical protein
VATVTAVWLLVAIGLSMIASRAVWMLIRTDRFRREVIDIVLCGVIFGLGLSVIRGYTILVAALGLTLGLVAIALVILAAGSASTSRARISKDVDNDTPSRVPDEC